jgi:hypothetical protein
MLKRLLRRGSGPAPPAAGPAVSYELPFCGGYGTEGEGLPASSDGERFSLESRRSAACSYRAHWATQLSSFQLCRFPDSFPHELQELILSFLVPPSTFYDCCPISSQNRWFSSEAARIRLEEQPEATELSYLAQFMVFASDPNLQIALLEHFCQTETGHTDEESLVMNDQTVHIDGDLTKLTIWLGPKDLPLAPTTKEKRRSISQLKGGQLLCRGITGYIVLYSAGNKISLKHASDRLQQICKHGSPNAGVLLLRCESQLTDIACRASTEMQELYRAEKETARKLADTRASLFARANLDTGEHVKEAVVAVLHDVMLRRVHGGAGAPEITIKKKPGCAFGVERNFRHVRWVADQEFDGHEDPDMP